MTPPFIDVSELMGRLDDPRLRLVDARSLPYGSPASGLSGAEQYAAGHVPGAVHLEYAAEVADAATPHAARVAPADVFARAVCGKGLGDDTTIVAYDAGSVPYAARIVWNFHYYGHSAAFILAGGLPAWVAAGGALSIDVPAVVPATFRPRIVEQLRASYDEVLSVARGESSAQLVETQRDHTYGLRDVDIAGAVRLSGNVLLEDERGGRIAAPERLARRIEERKLDCTRRTIVSCGSGVSAAGSYFALRTAGFTDVAVYDGSWLEWKHKGGPTVSKPRS